jgi:hypothetical protein
MPLACIIRARTHDQKNDCFFYLEMINNDYNYARGGFPLETYQPPMYARTSGAGTGIDDNLRSETSDSKNYKINIYLDRQSEFGISIPPSNETQTVDQHNNQIKMVDEVS